MMQGSLITDPPSISAGGAWGFTAPSAVYQAPGVERVGWGPQGSSAGCRRSYPPGAAGVRCSWSTRAWGDRPMKSGSPQRPKPLAALRPLDCCGFGAPAHRLCRGIGPAGPQGCRRRGRPSPLLAAAGRLGDLAPGCRCRGSPGAPVGPHAGSARLARSAAAASRASARAAAALFMAAATISKASGSPSRARSATQSRSSLPQETAEARNIINWSWLGSMRHLPFTPRLPPFGG